MNDDHDHTTEPAQGDALDALLRGWHDEHKTAASASRDAILRELDAQLAREKRPGILGRIGFGRMLSAAAVLGFAATLAFLFVRANEQPAFAQGGVFDVAEGGALDALDADGNTLGPCPLQHTEVKVEITGLFVRTIVEQTYANPYPRTIEAVYTFPLSEKAAVDRMTMVVKGPGGEKFIEGEVRERALARAIYEEARESGYVASLLEQERPNIFTQSVANIEPGATVRVQIATVELARRRNGVAEFVFPMVVGPRYIPGQPAAMPQLPAGWSVREGVVLRAPAGIEIAEGVPFGASRLSELLRNAIPVRAAGTEVIDRMLQIAAGVRFTAKYGNGSAERGVYFPAEGLGELNGRFFHAPLGVEQGAGFAENTRQVPDASRITPMPVKPSERAGHDIGISVSLDSGGPAITEVASELHAVAVRNDGPAARTITLVDRKTIPNRDFILRWRVADGEIAPALFPHAFRSADLSVDGGYFLLTLDPPARVAQSEIRPRELVFVLDTSGSMSGFPIEKSKALAQKAIQAMRPNDTFNFITFAGATRILWPEPRAATEENRRIASEFVANAESGGGTEMMTAINAALVQEGRSGLAPARLLDLPADGRAVRVAVDAGRIVRGDKGLTIDAGDGRSIAALVEIALPSAPAGKVFLIDGNWVTRDGDRVFVARTARFEDTDARTRLVFFLTDGYIGNDQGVVAAVRDNARASRVFSFGIGNSVNRFLLEEMARAGRGVCEVVTLAESADPVIDRLVRRIESPVLTDISIEIPPSLGLTEVLPQPDRIPDLFDEEPIVIVGRYKGAASGTITVRGRTGAGAWEKSISVALPEAESRHGVVKTLWARAKVDDIIGPHLAAVESQTVDGATKRAVIRLGESYAIATPFTSFVAVEKSRVVVGGKPMFVAVPVELPDGTSWPGLFGDGAGPASGEAIRWFADEIRRRGILDSASGSSSQRDSSFDTFEISEPGAPMAPTTNSQMTPKKAAPAIPGRAPTLSPQMAPVSARSTPSGSTPALTMPSMTMPSMTMPSMTMPSTASPSIDTPRGWASWDASAGSGVEYRQLSRLAVFPSELAELTLDSREDGTLEVFGSPKESAEPEKPREELMPKAELERLMRVLDERLAALAIAEILGDAKRVEALAAELGIVLLDGRVLVAARVEAGARDRIAALGLAIEAEDTGRGLVVMRVAPGAMRRLAATEGVRRVEPVRP